MARQQHPSKPAGASGIEENRSRKASEKTAQNPPDVGEKMFTGPGYQNPGDPRPYFGRQEPQYGEGGAFGRQQDDSPTGGQVGAHGPQENVGGTIQRPVYPSGKTPSEIPSPKEPKS